MVNEEEYDARTDIWSLGNVILELIAGGHPWKHENRSLLHVLTNVCCFGLQRTGAHFLIDYESKHANPRQHLVPSAGPSFTDFSTSRKSDYRRGVVKRCLDYSEAWSYSHSGLLVFHDWWPTGHPRASMVQRR